MTPKLLCVYMYVYNYILSNQFLTPYCTPFTRVHTDRLSNGMLARCIAHMACPAAPLWGLHINQRLWMRYFRSAALEEARCEQKAAAADAYRKGQYLCEESENKTYGIVSFHGQQRRYYSMDRHTLGVMLAGTDSYNVAIQMLPAPSHVTHTCQMSRYYI